MYVFSVDPCSIAIDDAIFSLDVSLAHAACIGDETHQALADIFDLIVLM